MDGNGPENFILALDALIPYSRGEIPCLSIDSPSIADQVQMPEHDVAAMQALLDDAYRNNWY